MNPLKLIKALLTSSPRFSPRDCAQRLRSGEAILVDVREPNEWKSGVARDAVLLSFSDLTGRRLNWTPFLSQTKSREILLYCASGTRSGIAARMLSAEGFQAANTGGFVDWTDSGWPVSPSTRR
jgi:rhodanese-related sulfurtransferase